MPLAALVVLFLFTPFGLSRGEMPCLHGSTGDSVVTVPYYVLVTGAADRRLCMISKSLMEQFLPHHLI
jgi:hypothetical protein